VNIRFRTIQHDPHFLQNIKDSLNSKISAIGNLLGLIIVLFNVAKDILRRFIQVSSGKRSVSGSSEMQLEELTSEISSIANSEVVQK
jgi:hypothetical protein